MTVQNRDQVGMFFPTPIQTSDLGDAEDLNRSLMPHVDALIRTTPNNVPGNWSCALYTTMMTADDLHLRPEFQRLTDHIMSEATKFANVVKLDIARHPLSITSCWLNVYGKDHSQEIHAHANHVISGVYYLKMPPGAAGILFHSPWSNLMLAPPLAEVDMINNLSFLHQPNEGQMVIFRSCLQHSVPANPVEGQRMSIAFNLTM